MHMQNHFLVVSMWTWISWWSWNGLKLSRFCICTLGTVLDWGLRLQWHVSTSDLDFWSLTLASDLDLLSKESYCHVPYTCHATGQGQTSLGLVVKSGHRRIDRRIGGDCITSHANTVGKNYPGATFPGWLFPVEPGLTSIPWLSISIYSTCASPLKWNILLTLFGCIYRIYSMLEKSLKMFKLSQAFECT